MKHKIRQIDEALRKLYQLPSEHPAENYLIPSEKMPQQRDAVILISHRGQTQIGIAFQEKTQQALATLPDWNVQWSISQTNAFINAVEEISHFRYLVHQMRRKREVSQLELELQGEVDKFAVTYLAKAQDVVRFDELYRQLFEHFHLRSDLSREEQERYVQANQHAKRFVYRLRNVPRDRMLASLRAFYGKPLSRKIG